MKNKKLLLLTLVIVCISLFAFAACSQTPDDTTADSVTEEGDNVPGEPVRAELEDGAIYRITINDEETFDGGAITAANFAMEDNAMLKLELYARHLSQLWKVHKNDDGTYSFENMASRMYMSVRNPENVKKEKKLSVCLEGTNDVAKSWEIYTSDGTIENCVIKNVHSGLLASVVSAKGVKTNYVQQENEGKGVQSWSFKKMSEGEGKYPYMLVLSGDNLGSASCPEIIYHNGVYYNYNMTGTITVKTSTDMLNWTKLDKTALGTRPTWLKDIVAENDSGVTGIWAPGAYKIGDKFFLYYCSSSSGSQNSAIGVAISDDPAKNDWKDQGLVIRSYDSKDKYGKTQTASNFNAIDPNVFVDDDGTPYLIYGSYWTGVYMKKLDPQTGKFADPDAAPTHLAKGLSDMEAPYLIKHGNYYYLFVARGGLKKGTYYWAVGRSEKLEGPYVDKDGQTMLSGNGGTRLTEWKEGIEGAAHAQLFVGPDGQSYMVTESWVDRSVDNPQIRLTIGTVEWTEDGWPVTALDKNVLKALGE